MVSILQSHPLLKILNNALIDLPSPSSLSRWWNFGSILGFCLGVQLVTGVLLAIWFVGDPSLAFFSVSHLGKDVTLGWLVRIIHANGARFFFIALYMHTARGLYYGSYQFHLTWAVGVVLIFLVIAAAFLGYVLPWGQISFWGARVITGLFSAVPFLGPEIVTWLWGRFAVDRATLTRFFALHFLVPFLASALALVHLLFLHQTGSNNPLGLSLNADKIPFHPYFTSKDLLGIYSLILISLLLCTQSPWMLRDPENFIEANPLVTPPHIQPEWYFLFAYAILRSIPNKLGGVVALVLSILMLLTLTALPSQPLRGFISLPPGQWLFWIWSASVITLTWIGARRVEEPYILCGQLFTCLYFLYFVSLPPTFQIWNLASR